MASQNSWGGQFPLGGSANQIAAAQNADGRLEIFYVGTNGDLFRNTQMEADGLLWGGQAAFPGNSAQQIAAARNQNGVLEIFYVGTNSDLYHNMQTAPGSATWVGETHFPGDSAKQVAVGTNADGLLEIFYVGTNNDLYHNRQLSPDGAWAGQVSFPGNSARQIAVGQNEDGRLEIFYVGTNNDLYHNWQTQPNGTAWNGETPFQGNSAQQVTVARNDDGRLEIFYVGTNNELYHNWQTAPGSPVWFGETSFQGNSGLQVAAGVNFGGRLEIFYVGTDNTLYHNWQTEADALAWNGQTAFSGDSAKQVTVAQNQDFRLEIFYVGTNNDIYHQWQTPPAQGFGSNSNYILASNCNPLLGVTVTIDVTQDIAAAANTGPTSGFSFQLNAFSPENEKCAFQQYGFTVFGSDIAGFVDNWTIQDSNIVRDYFSMVSLPSPKIPAGYKLTISLQNDAQGNITGATYTVADDNGKTLASGKKVLTSLTGIGAISANASDLAPIVAFELDLVGPVNGEGAVLSSGAGTFTYTATTPLTALASEPPCAEFNRGKGTAETANSEYGTLPAQASTSLTQSFSVSLTAAAMWRKKGIARPGLIVPAGTVIPKASS
jgi:hypothetical protein